MRQLDEVEIEKLTSGGECDMHFHTPLRDHLQIENIQSLDNIRSITANYSVLNNDDIIIGDTSAGNITVTLPTSAGQREYIVVKSSALNTLTVAFSDGATCFGAATVDLTALGESKRFKAYDTDWITI